MEEKGKKATMFMVLAAGIVMILLGGGAYLTTFLSGAAVNNSNVDTNTYPYYTGNRANWYPGNGVQVSAGRLGGADRYETAALVSKEVFPDRSVKSLVVVSADSYPDALAATTLSTKLQSPILFARKDSIPTATSAEIARVIKPTTDPVLYIQVYVVGGTSVLSDAAVQQIHAIQIAGQPGGLSVKRIASVEEAQ